MINDLKNKIIIRNYTDIDDLQVLDYIKVVVAGGKISSIHNQKCYCALMTFKSGIVISVEPRGDTTTFYFL